MERKETSIKELLEKRTNKTLTDEDVEDLWYDWFCKDKAILNRGKALLSRLSSINKANSVNKSKFDPEKTYTFFKNNCPVNGRLYDDFRICDIETGDVIWTIIPKSGHYVDEGRAFLWGKVNDFREPVVEGTWKDIVEYFKS